MLNQTRYSDKKGTCHSAQIKPLKRIEGQVRGIIKMVEDERYCLDILNQLKAAKAALGRVEQKVMGDHMANCLDQALKSKNSKVANEMLEELQLLLKSAIP